MTRQRPVVPAKPAGTVAVICVELLTVNAAATFASVTEVAPVKLVPVIVIWSPAVPCIGVAKPSFIVQIP